MLQEEGGEEGSDVRAGTENMLTASGVRLMSMQRISSGKSPEGSVGGRGDGRGL